MLHSARSCALFRALDLALLYRCCYLHIVTSAVAEWSAFVNLIVRWKAFVESVFGMFKFDMFLLCWGFCVASCKCLSLNRMYYPNVRIMRFCGTIFLLKSSILRLKGTRVFVLRTLLVECSVYHVGRNGFHDSMKGTRNVMQARHE